MNLLAHVLSSWCRTEGYPEPEPEFLFHPSRLWRFDLAWKEEMIALEIEGGTRQGGRHTRHKGYSEDAIKYSEAALLGWCVLRCTSEQIAEGRHFVYLERAFAMRGGK
jgi:hypothetical protein